MKEARALSALGEWQRRLGEHFTRLHSEQVIGKPVFALQQGLGETEFEQLAAAIRGHIRRAEPVNDHVRRPAIARLPNVLWHRARMPERSSWRYR